MARKNLYLRKIENFVRRNSYPKYMSKDKGEKKANFRKTCKSTLKSLMSTYHTKKKEGDT